MAHTFSRSYPVKSYFILIKFRLNVKLLRALRDLRGTMHQGLEKEGRFLEAAGSLLFEAVAS